MIDIPETSRKDQRSTALLTAHRAGSKVASWLIAKIHAQAGMPHVDLERSARDLNEPPAALRGLLDLPGYYFGPIRGPAVAGIGSYAKARPIVHVRDPRDCLVSAYFSTAWSHPLPPGNRAAILLARRANARAASIDEFCLAHTRGRLATYNALLEIRDNHPDCIVSRYEDMVTNLDDWVRGIASFARVPMTEALHSELRKMADFGVSSEDVARSKRQVQPGDHLRKLKPDTVAHLTKVFQHSLQHFGYV